MSPNVPLAAGWLLVLVGEVWGYHRAGPAVDTTSEWIWQLEAQPYGIIVRAVVLVALVGLACHLAFGWWAYP